LNLHASKLITTRLNIFIILYFQYKENIFFNKVQIFVAVTSEQYCIIHIFYKELSLINFFGFIVKKKRIQRIVRVLYLTVMFLGIGYYFLFCYYTNLTKR